MQYLIVCVLYLVFVWFIVRSVRINGPELDEPSVRPLTAVEVKRALEDTKRTHPTYPCVYAVTDTSGLTTFHAERTWTGAVDARAQGMKVTML